MHIRGALQKSWCWWKKWDEIEDNGFSNIPMWKIFQHILQVAIFAPCCTRICASWRRPRPSHRPREPPVLARKVARLNLTNSVLLTSMQSRNPIWGENKVTINVFKTLKHSRNKNGNKRQLDWILGVTHLDCRKGAGKLQYRYGCWSDDEQLS